MSKPAPTQSSSFADLDQLQSLADHKLSQLVKKYPAFDRLLIDQNQVTQSSTKEHVIENNQINSQLISLPSSTPPLIAPVTSDEVKELFVKLRSVIINHQLWQDDSVRLYLEQHITDLIGFSVTSQIDQDMIPVWHGRVLALPHQKRWTGDTLIQHGSHLEAGLGRYRSSLQLKEQHDELIQIEQYAVHYPVWLLKNYQASPHQAFDQIGQFKWLLINPIAQRLVVGESAGILSPSHRYGLGLSPELIRLGRFWWPGMTGDTLCLLIDKNTPSGLLYA